MNLEADRMKRLPAWARRKIHALQQQVDALQERANSIKTNVFVKTHNLDAPLAPLPENASLLFRLAGGEEIEVHHASAHDPPGLLVVRRSDGSSLLSVRPAASNLIYVEGVK